MKKIIFLIAIFSISFSIFSQLSRQETLSNIFGEIFKCNYYKSVWDSLSKNYVIVYEPIEGVANIVSKNAHQDFDTAINGLTAKEFKEGVLEVYDWSIFPIKDTLFVLDKDNYFETEYVTTVKDPEIPIRELIFKVLHQELTEEKYPVLEFLKANENENGTIYYFRYHGVEKILYSFEILKDNSKGLEILKRLHS